MSGFNNKPWTAEDEFVFNWNLLWTSQDYWERTPENQKRREEDLRKLYRRTVAEKDKVIEQQREIINVMLDRLKSFPNQPTEAVTGEPLYKTSLTEDINEFTQELKACYYMKVQDLPLLPKGE